MLKQISSTSFIEATAVVTVLYYLAVGLLFYRNDIRDFLANKVLKRPDREGQGATPL